MPHRLATILTAAALVAGSVTTVTSAVTSAGATGPGSGSAQGGGSSDPVGDVHPETGVVPVTQAELDSIDLTRVTYRLTRGRTVRFRLDLVDVTGASDRRRRFYGVIARAGREVLVLGVRQGHVVVVEAGEPRRCPGSTALVDGQRDLVRFEVPVDCFATADRYRFTPVALVESRRGRDLAEDRSPLPGRLAVR